MPYPLTGDETLIVDTVRRFARERVLPRAAEIDRTGAFPRDLVDDMARLGLMGLCLPDACGGAGQSFVLHAMIVEELSAACASIGLILDAHLSLCAWPILRFGDAWQRRTFLEPLAAGARLGALAATESAANADAAATTTGAVRDGEWYLLSGTKMSITNGGEADFYVVTAATDPDAGRAGISAFIVERGTAGVQFGPPAHRMGLRGAATTEVILDRCRIPRAHLLGAEGQGYAIMMSARDAGRIGMAAQAVGIARGALAEAVAYITQRKQFGATIASFQAIRFMVADMATQIEAARLLTLRAAELRERRVACARETAMARLFAGDTAMRVTTDALQLFGGYGYMKEFPAERHMRDAKMAQIYEGTNQIQRAAIARSLLGQE